MASIASQLEPTTLSDVPANSQEPVDAQRHGIRFGEFLAALDALPPEELAGALVASKQLGIPLGRTLVVRRLVSNEDLGRLLEFHGLYRRSLCDLEQIREAFSLSKDRGFNVKESLAAIGCPVDEIESVRLGELLLAAQLIDVNQLNNALSLQELCGLPLGRVLSIHFGFPQELVEAALNFQSNIRQKSVSYAEAVDQLKIMPLSLPPTTMKPLLELDFRDLLIAGKVCSESDVQTATNFALSNNLPLQQVLCGFTWIDPNLVSATLGLSKLVEGGYIAGHDAVNFLVNAATARASKSDTEDTSDKLNLHKFLLACGFLTPQDIKEIARIIVTRKKEFADLVGQTIDDDTPKTELQKLVFACFADDALLAELLVRMFGSDELVMMHARNLVDLLAINGATVEQAILSFAAIRRDVTRFNTTAGSAS